MWRNENDLTLHTMSFWDSLDCSWLLSLRSYSRSLTTLCHFSYPFFHLVLTQRHPEKVQGLLNIPFTASGMYMITWKGFTSCIFLYHFSWGSVLYISLSVKSFSSYRTYMLHLTNYLLICCTESFIVWLYFSIRQLVWLFLFLSGKEFISKGN